MVNLSCDWKINQSQTEIPWHIHFCMKMECYSLIVLASCVSIRRVYTFIDVSISCMHMKTIKRQIKDFCIPHQTECSFFVQHSNIPRPNLLWIREHFTSRSWDQNILNHPSTLVCLAVHTLKNFRHATMPLRWSLPELAIPGRGSLEEIRDYKPGTRWHRGRSECEVTHET